MSKTFFCTPSNTNFLATFRCLSLQFSFVFLRSKARAGSSQIPSSNSSYSCFPAHFFQLTVLACCTSIFFTAFGHTCLMSMLTSPSTIKACPCGHLMPKSLVSHIAATAGPLASTFGLKEPDSSKLLCVQLAIFQSTLQVWVAIVESPSTTSGPKASMKRDSEFVLSLSAAAQSPLHALPTLLLVPNPSSTTS